MVDKSDRSIRIEGDASHSILIPGDGNTVYVTHQGMVEQENIGRNPYMGLAAFGERDADRYFGRETQVERLWQRLRVLYEQSTYTDAVPRLLPILGPSGCGKSSLALAGLLPALTRRPLPSISSLRVAVMRPGAQPLEALAGVLAKVGSVGDPMPVTKTREFTEELSRRGDDGLRRIVALMPQITASPLVLLVDQFEETYSLCKDSKVRRSFIDNLLCAAADPTGNVSVVITLRSDFLGEAQRHQGLNQVIGSDQSAILPAMTAAELGRAIAEPAKRAGHPLEAAVVDRLVQDVEGREGALPLLQYALFRIWEGLEAGREPLETYLAMGGVGGALASKAEEIYTALSASEQEIAERVFIGLVQVGEGDRDTRRQVSIKSLVTRRYGFAKIRAVIDKYSGRGARFITLATDGNGEMVAEVAHEALFKNWKRFMDWLGDRRDDIRLQQRLEAAAIYWDAQERPAGLLWRSPDLDRLRIFVPTTDLPLHPHCIDFFHASDQAERREQRLKRLRLAALSIGLVLTTGLSILAGYQVRRATLRQIDVYEAEARNLAELDPLGSMVNGLAAIGLGQNPLVKLPWIGSQAPVSTAVLDLGNRYARFTWVTLGHLGGVTSVALSSNMETLVSGGRDGMVRLWDRMGQPIGEPGVGHQGWVLSVAISPDGETVVSGAEDGVVILRDRRGQIIAKLSDHGGWVTSVAVSPDGETIVSGVGTGKVHLWNHTGQPLGEIVGHQGQVTSVAASWNGELVVSGGEDGTVRLWNRTGQSLGEIVGHQSEVTSVAVSWNGEIVVSGGEDGTVRLWNRTGQSLGEIVGHQGKVTSVAVSRNGEMVVSGSLDGTVRLWTHTGQSIGEPWLANSNGVDSVTLSPDGETVISGGGDGTVRLWDRNSQSIQEPWVANQNGVTSVAWSQDGRTLVSGGGGGTVYLWDSAGRPITQLFDAHRNWVMSVAISPDGEIMISGGGDGKVRLWDRRGQSIAEIFEAHRGGVMSVAISSDGETVASGGSDGVRLWDRTGQPIGELFANNVWGWITSVALGSDGGIIVSGGDDGVVRIWDRTGQLLGEPLTGHQGVVTSVALSSNEEVIASGGEDGTVRLWNRAGQPIGEPLAGHEGVVTSVALSSDGETIVSGGEDGTVRLWNHTGQPVGEPLVGHQDGVTSVALSSDGQTIVSGGNDGKVRMWPVGSVEVKWVRYTCDRIRGYLISTSDTDETARLARRTCERFAWR